MVGGPPTTGTDTAPGSICSPVTTTALRRSCNGLRSHIRARRSTWWAYRIAEPQSESTWSRPKCDSFHPIDQHLELRHCLPECGILEVQVRLEFCAGEAELGIDRHGARVDVQREGARQQPSPPAIPASWWFAA